MTKRGKLSGVEKLAIQGALHQGQSTKEIATTLDRSEASIKKYVEGEYNDLISTIAGAKLEAHEKQKRDTVARILLRGDTPDTHVYYPNYQFAEDDVIEGAAKQLKAAGMVTVDIGRVLARVEEKAKASQKFFETVPDVYMEAVKQMKAGQWMIKQSSGGNTGVAVMTGNASMRVDEMKKNMPATKEPDYIFRPKG